MGNLINHFQKIDLPDPVDLVIQQIKDLIHSGVLKPGDRLPAERRIEEKMGIHRGPINRALRRLETYGILKTVPQSGTYVAAIGVNALEGMLTNVLKIEDKEFESLDDTRYILEIYAVELVTRNANDEDIQELERVQQGVSEKIRSGSFGFEEDMVFHLKIAEHSKNSILKSILTLLIADVINMFKEFEKVIGSEMVHSRLMAAIEEHERIVEAIKGREPEKAALVMREHFEKAKKFRKRVLSEVNGNAR